MGNGSRKKNPSSSRDWNDKKYSVGMYAHTHTDVVIGNRAECHAKPKLWSHFMWMKRDWVSFFSCKLCCFLLHFRISVSRGVTLLTISRDPLRSLISCSKWEGGENEPYQTEGKEQCEYSVVLTRLFREMQHYKASRETRTERGSGFVCIYTVQLKKIFSKFC